MSTIVPPNPPPKSHGARAALLRALLLVFVLGTAALLARQFGLHELADPARLGDAIQRARGMPAIGVVFVVAYAVAAGLGLPATPFTLAGGVLFGVVGGSVLNWAGALAASTVTYWLGRGFGADALRGVLGRHARALDVLEGSTSVAALLRLRLIPIVPFNGLNLAAGLVRIPWMRFFGSTALGIIPGTVIYTYFADSLVNGVTNARAEAFVHLAVAAALLIGLSFVPAIVTRIRSERGRLGANAGLAVLALPVLAFPFLPTHAAAQPARGATEPPGLHEAFDALLQRHVRDGLVDYAAFAAAPSFRDYLDRLAATEPSALGRNEQLALWINAYNAYTIALIVGHDERESIRNINKSLGILRLKGPWSEPIARVGGVTYTLDQVEHDIIRKRFGDARIHFAIVCAAIGCPPLRSEAYTGERLTAQLDEQAMEFLTKSPARNRVDVARRTVYLSRIFDWFKEDFGGSNAHVTRFIARYYPPGAERELLESGRADVKYTEYDWTLNAMPRREP